MEDVVMEAAPLAQEFNDDFCSAVLSEFSNSNDDHYLHICTTIGTISQELKDQNLRLSPIAYFGATCSSLDRLCSASAEPTGHLLDALITILSLVVDKCPPTVLRTRYVYLSELLIRTLRVKTIGFNGVVPGLKCAFRLLIVREKVEWGEVAQLYGVFVSYISDDRSKVRKQSHSCLRGVLEFYQSVPGLAPVLAPASEAITNIFERFLLLAQVSNSNASEKPKGGAQEVLYILDALKKCLPYMSSKSSANVLKYFKTLLEVRNPLVTRPITDALHALCNHSVAEVSTGLLLDLLCSLATLVSLNESSADSMAFTARLLDSGMKRIYSLDRLLCVVKLPVIFNALKEILSSGHEAAVVAAVAAFKSLIHSCVDDILIKQGVDQIEANTNGTTRKSGPTVIEKICATIESLLDYHCEAVWDKSFQIISIMYRQLGEYSFYLLKGTLKNLADMEKIPDEDFGLRKQLHECVGAALGAMGPERFLRILPLNLEVQDLSEANLWLFPILKHYTVGARLKYFTESILPMIGKMKRMSDRLEQEGSLYSARAVDGIVYSLWSLLPSFCNYPVDTAESFQGLKKALCTALCDEPDALGIICSSLQILIQQNKRIRDGNENNTNEISIPEERAIALYTSDVASANLGALKSSAKELFFVLHGVYLKSTKDTCGILEDTIGQLSSIANEKDVMPFFTKTLTTLLEVTRKAAEPRNSPDSMQVDNSPHEGSLATRRGQLLVLAVSFLPGLDQKAVDVLFVAVQPALKDADGLIQKKAYRVLSLMLQSEDFISRKLEKVHKLMAEELSSCHFSAKRHRLDCLYFLILHVCKDGSEESRQIILPFLVEIILALKEVNKKTRNRAYDILVQIGRAYDIDQDGGKDKLYQLFNMVAGGLAGESPHMISAAMKGLARLAYEFSDLVSAAYNVLPSTLLLLQRKNREIVKANLGLMKVLVAKSRADSLQTHLRSIVEGLLNWQDNTRNHFRAKAKLLLEMLVKKCGLDAVKEVMPEEHMKLLTNIRKLKERKEKKYAAKSVEARSIISKATTSRISHWNHTKIFSDLNDEETMNSNGEFVDKKSISSRRTKLSLALRSQAPVLRSKKARMAAKSLQEENFEQFDDEPLDLLDRQKTRAALRSSEPLKRKAESDDEPEIDSEGRLVIHEDGKGIRVNRKRDVPSDTEAEGKSEAGSYLFTRSRQAQKRRKTTESGWAYAGKEYASRKASGDVKRKDKLEPYAYWPLDRKMVSRRPEHRAAARKGMSSVVKLTKKLEGKSASSVLAMKGASLKKAKRKGNKMKA